MTQVMCVQVIVRTVGIASSILSRRSEYELLRSRSRGCCFGTAPRIDFNGPLSGRFGPGPPSCGQAGCTRYLWAGDSQVDRRRTAIGPIVGPLLEPGISGCEPSPGVFCVVT